MVVPDYESNYEEQYSAYNRYSNEHPKTVETLSPLVKLSPSGTPKTVNILSVGCGDGDFDLRFLAAVVPKLDDDVVINYVCVEPDKAFIAKFQAAIDERKPSCLKNVSLKFLPLKIEEYLAEWVSSKQYFNLAIFAHSIEHITEKDPTLLKVVKEVLVDGGECILLYGTQNESVKKYFTAMFAKAGTTYSGMDGSCEDFAAETVEQLTSRLDLKFTKHLIEAEVDITCAFDESSIDGNLILDFVNLKEYARKNIARDSLAENIELLLTYCIVKGDRKVLSSEVAALVIPKQ